MTSITPRILRLPLSGRYETWTLYFNLHERFPDLGSPRRRERKLTSDDGFAVVMPVLEREDPTSHGAQTRAFALQVEKRYRSDSHRLHPPVAPPALFGARDGGGVSRATRRTARVTEPLAWYRTRRTRCASRINTHQGPPGVRACHTGDPTPYGGNDWCISPQHERSRGTDRGADGERASEAPVLRILRQPRLQESRYHAAASRDPRRSYTHICGRERERRLTIPHGSRLQEDPTSPWFPQRQGQSRASGCVPLAVPRALPTPLVNAALARPTTAAVRART